MEVVQTQEMNWPGQARVTLGLTQVSNVGSSTEIISSLGCDIKSSFDALNLVQQRA